MRNANACASRKCGRAHTLCTGGRERKREREKKREGERDRKRERRKDGEIERVRKRERVVV
jgi:hypothetical protein